MSWFWGSSKKTVAPAEEEDAKQQKLRTSVSSTLAVRRRADEGGSFSSTKCPPGPDLENSCELPFGFVWTPMAERLENNGDASAHKVTVIPCPSASLPPILCLTCLTYINPYCELNKKTGVWNCALCGAQNVLPKKFYRDSGSEGNGWLKPALEAKQVEYHQPIPLPPNQEGDTSKIILVVDANLEPHEAQGVLKAVKQVVPSMLEESSGDSKATVPKVQLGLVVFDSSVSMYQLGVSGVASADIYDPADNDDDAASLLERRSPEEQLTFLKSIKSVNDLDSVSQCLSAVFGVSMENPIPETAAAGKLSRKEMLKKRKEDRMRQEELKAKRGPKSIAVPNESPWVQRSQQSAFSPEKRCTGEALQCAIDMTTIGDSNSRTSRILLFTNGCPNTGDGTVVAEEEDDTKTKTGPTKKKLSKSKKKKVNVDGASMSKALEYFDMTGNLGLETGIAFDVLCTGALELGLPAYQALVEPSGGYVLPHTTFEGPHLTHNLTYLLKHTYVSRTTCEFPTPSADESETKSGLARIFGRSPKKGPSGSDEGMSECILDIRSDSFIIPTHLVGPGEVIDTASNICKNEKGAFAEGLRLATSKELLEKQKLPNQEALDLSLTRVRMPRVDPLASLGVMLRVNDTFERGEDKFAFFQMTVRFLDKFGAKMITRVTTHRIPVAKNVGDYVKNIDDEVVSVLLGKSAVYRSLHGREETEDTKDKIVAGDTDTLEKLAHEAQLDLDATIQRISGAFRLLGLEEKAKQIDSDSESEDTKTQSSLDFAFPPQLNECLPNLYHLRRGSLISPGPMKSMDDRAGMRQLFLRFPLDDCIGMMAPKLWSTGLIDERITPATAQKLPFPAETLALWDESIIAADQHDVQFVWSGKGCPKNNTFQEVRKEFRKFLIKKAKDRFPMPEIHMLFDGDSMSRRFTTRLAPSHADSEVRQLANFPQLSNLSSKSLSSLRSRFEFYDSASDASFRKWFWSISSATNASREDGMSLCE